MRHWPSRHVRKIEADVEQLRKRGAVPSAMSARE
jgi:hypothetical protein